MINGAPSGWCLVRHLDGIAGAFTPPALLPRPGKPRNVASRPQRYCHIFKTSCVNKDTAERENNEHVPEMQQ